MVQPRNNIFQAIGNWIESKQLSWIFPNKKETLNVASKKLVILTTLLPLLFIALIIRLFVYLLKLLSFPIMHAKDEKSVNSLRIAASIKTFLFGLFISMITMYSMKKLYNHSKENNVNLIEIRNYSYTEIPIYEVLPNNWFLNRVYQSVFEACQRDYSSQKVMKLRRNLFIDDDFASGLHFAEPEDFIAYLYSLKDIDKDVPSYLNEVDNSKGLGVEELLDMYKIGAREDYENGDYYSAAEMTQHYFNLYSVFNNFATESKDVNNIMHILKLLLQHRWTLSTNRSFAINALKLITFLEDNNSKNVEFSFLEEKYSNNIIKELCGYFKGITLFHNENYQEAIEQFETCYKTCSDKLLQQYCSLMIIRTAFWNYDKERTQENLRLFKKNYSSYSPSISLPYFLPDIKKYENIVKKIANNPDYSG